MTLKLTLEVSSIDDARAAHHVLDSYEEAIDLEQMAEDGRSFENTHPSVLSSPPISNAAVSDHAEGWTGEVKIEPFAPTPFEEVKAKAEEALGDDDSGYSKPQIKQAAEHDPELKRLISGKGRRSAETKVEIQRRTAAYFNGEVIVAEVDAPVGKAFDGMSAEDLQAALNFGKPECPPVEEPLVESDCTHMTKEQLLKEAAAFCDRFDDPLQGLRWWKNAVNQSTETVSEDRLRAALRDPEAFLS